jgi:hypothetical protein
MARTWLEMILTMTEDGGHNTAVAGADSDMAASSVESYSSTQYSVMDGRGTEAESREPIAGVDGNLEVGAGLETMVT